MRKLLLLLVASVSGLLLPATPAAARGVLLLSGDSNIINALDGTFSAPIDSGNQQFFRNVIGASDEVVIHAPLDFPQTVWANSLRDFVIAETGAAAAVISGPLSAANLTATDLLVLILPAAPYSAEDVKAARQVLQSGGSIFALGENAGRDFLNGFLNAALIELGSNLRLGPGDTPSGFQTSTGDLISADPLTVGVLSFTSAAGRGVTGGAVLFYATNGLPVVTYEEYPFRVVPEPSVLGLLLLGAGGFRIRQRRRRALRHTRGEAHISSPK
jgi:hypothetical protein